MPAMKLPRSVPAEPLLVRATAETELLRPCLVVAVNAGSCGAKVPLWTLDSDSCQV
jgi:hypothetical protein